MTAATQSEGALGGSAVADTEAKPERIVARALMVGDRIDAAGLERGEMVATAPLALRLGSAKFVALYRFGVVVFVGFTKREEQRFLEEIVARIAGAQDRKNDETAMVELDHGYDDRVCPAVRFRCRIFPRLDFWSLPTCWPRRYRWPATKAR